MKKWIQTAIWKPGTLHKQLGIEKDVKIPITLLNRIIVEPNRSLPATTWSPPFSSPMQVATIALIPVAVATQHSPSSIAASLSSKVRTFGLVKSE